MLCFFRSGVNKHLSQKRCYIRSSERTYRRSASLPMPRSRAHLVELSWIGLGDLSRRRHDRHGVEALAARCRKKHSRASNALNLNGLSVKPVHHPSLPSRVSNKGCFRVLGVWWRMAQQYCLTAEEQGLLCCGEPGTLLLPQRCLQANTTALCSSISYGDDAAAISFHKVCGLTCTSNAFIFTPN